LLEENHLAVLRGENVDRYVRHMRTTVMKIVECLDARFFEMRLLAHTVAAPGKDALASHAANVAVLSLVMGRLLGLTRGQLITLGFAALYHDLGRALTGRFPDPPGEREDPEAARRHLADGVRVALGGKGLTDAGTMRLVVIQEHHMMCDGYPQLEAGPRKPHLFSRIVSVADAFDKLQNGTPWAKAQNPAQALRTLRREPRRYDNAVVELLQDVLGKAPRGTVLRLLKGDLVVVLEGGARFGHRPIVRRLLLANGQPDRERNLQQIELVEVKGEVDPALLRIDWRHEVLR
jgi:HD-GYP domain-containing protein (c-di-GMP phosphodiesterase class II)